MNLQSISLNPYDLQFLLMLLFLHKSQYICKYCSTRFRWQMGPVWNHMESTSGIMSISGWCSNVFTARLFALIQPSLPPQYLSLWHISSQTMIHIQDTKASIHSYCILYEYHTSDIFYCVSFSQETVILKSKNIYFTFEQKVSSYLSSRMSLVTIEILTIRRCHKC